MSSGFSSATIRTLVAGCASSQEEWSGPRSSAGWEELARAAVFHRVRPLLWLRAERDEMPRQVRSELATFVRYNRVISRLLRERQEELALSLERAGVRHRFLKGPSIAIRYYDEPSHREAGDIDLLIEAGSLASVDRALRDLDYGPWMMETATFGRSKELMYRNREPDPTPVWIDVHQRLFSATGDDALAEVLLAEDSPLEARLVHVAGHAAAHRMARLKHLIDLDRMLAEEPDWGRVHALVAGSALAPGIDLVFQRVAEISPGAVAGWTSSSSTMSGVALRGVSALAGSDLLEHLAAGPRLRGVRGLAVGMLMVRGVRPRLRQLGRSLFLDPVELRQSHGHRADEHLALIRIRRWAGKLAGVLPGGSR